MAALGPFAPRPRLAVAVSGGADSLALALLAADWAGARGGDVLGLVVDHGLRPESAAEAVLSGVRLAGCAIPSCILTLSGLTRGPGLAARARAARSTALAAAAAAAGRVQVLLGHQAADQAETVLMRRAGASGPAGLAGMAGWRTQAGVVWLRPLLGLPPGRLRAFLAGRGLGWIEDPSNRDPGALRARLRAGRADAAGEGVATVALLAAARARGAARAGAEGEAANWIARFVTLRPEGFALLPPGPWPDWVLAALVRTISGGEVPPPPAAVAALAAAPRAATLRGARLMAVAGGWLLLREAAAMAGPAPARAGLLWDRRFRLEAAAAPPPGAMIAALGAAAAGLRRRSPLPSAVLATLPALWLREALAAVPHLGYPDEMTCAAVPFLFAPAVPAAGAPHLV